MFTLKDIKDKELRDLLLKFEKDVTEETAAYEAGLPYDQIEADELLSITEHNLVEYINNKFDGE